MKWFNKNRSALRVSSKGIFLLDLDDSVHGSAVIVPNRFKFDIMQEAHERLAHQGATKTAEKMARRYQWPGYRDDVKRHVASCITCQEAKPPQRILRTKLQPIVTNAPGEILMIDYEKMTKAHDGSAGVLMMVDHYSKYCMAVPVPAFTAEEAAKAIWFKWIQSCGIPDVIHSDKGSHFDNALLQELFLHLGAVKTHTSGYHPQGNGLVERMNRTIVKCLAEASGQDQKAWPRHLTKVVMSYNMMMQASTGFSPYRLMFGREARTPLSLLFPTMRETIPKPKSEVVKEQIVDMARVAEVVRNNMRTAQIRQCRNHDKRMSRTPTLQVGQKAMVFIDVVKKDNTGKMTRKWRGPWEVVQVYGPGIGYRFKNGHKAHFERVRLYEPRLGDFRLNEKGEFGYVTTLGKPVLEIYPEDSELDET